MKNHTTTLQAHMKTLCETIGARPTGSVSNTAAVDYAFKTLKNCGFQTFKQEFDCIDWKNSGADLLVDGQNVPVVPAEYSMPCHVEARLTCLDTVDKLRELKISGKIAVLHGDLCNEPLMPKNFQFYNPDEHKEIISLLEEKSPAAIITISPNKEHIIQDGDFNIPCAAADVSVLERFLQNSDKKAKLIIRTERIPAKASNVIATHGASGGKICVCAHIDTKPNTPGALDNASGVAALLALAEALQGKKYPHQIEIVLFNGEDYYSVPGQMAYMAQLTPSAYSLAINVDGIGLKNSATSVSLYECPQSVEAQIMEQAAAIPGIEKIDPWPMGDHMLFAMSGVPAVAVTASGIFELLETITHTPDDDMRNIDINILDDTVKLLIKFLTS